MAVALVTGAARRVGRAVALELCGAGYDLLAHARSSAAELEALVAEVEALGRRCTPLLGDFATAEGQEAFAAAALRAAPALDLLVHNAAVYGRTPFAEVTREGFAEALRVNLEAPFFVTQRLLPALLRAPEPCVIHLGDSASERPYPAHAPYFAAKAGLDALTRALALELAPRVRVNAVAPGTVAFPEHFGEGLRRGITRAVPLGRTGTPEDIARAVRYLARDAPFVTGQILRVDGGRSIKP